MEQNTTPPTIPPPQNGTDGEVEVPPADLPAVPLIPLVADVSSQLVVETPPVVLEEVVEKENIPENVGEAIVEAEAEAEVEAEVEPPKKKSSSKRKKKHSR